MQRIAWDTSLETGNAIVDEHHRGLVQLFNELTEAEATGGDDDVQLTLERLSAYVLVHFAAEEDLMREHGYPAGRFSEHLAEHDGLTQNTRKLILEYRSGRVTRVGPIVDFMRKWLTEHVGHSDMEMIRFVRERSLGTDV